MTPFGAKLRKLRQERNITQKQMAATLGVSAAYLSALELGKRSAPSFEFVQRVAGHFNIIWDEAEDLIVIAGLSHPKVTLDTSGMEPEYTAFANRLSREISRLDRQSLNAMAEILAKATERS